MIFPNLDFAFWLLINLLISSSNLLSSVIIEGSRHHNWMKIPNTELQNTLFIYPLDGPGSLSTPEKLTGSKNHHNWCKSIEIQLSTKHKLVFV